MFLGRVANLKSKDGGENSMPRNAGGTPSRKGTSPVDPRPMAKARLLEPQFPSVNESDPRNTADYRVQSVCEKRCVAILARSDRLATTSGEFKGMSGEPKGRYHRQPVRTAGSPTGREPYGDGAPVVVRGRESRPHGEGGQVFTKTTELQAGGA
jgi:hypothetical protein